MWGGRRGAPGRGPRLETCMARACTCRRCGHRPVGHSDLDSKVCEVASGRTEAEAVDSSGREGIAPICHSPFTRGLRLNPYDADSLGFYCRRRSTAISFPRALRSGDTIEGSGGVRNPRTQSAGLAPPFLHCVYWELTSSQGGGGDSQVTVLQRGVCRPREA